MTKIERINVESIKLPDYAAVRKGNPGQQLVVIFTVDSVSSGVHTIDKFKCDYIQEHYFYDGIPGTYTEHLEFHKINRGSIESTIDCSGEFRIPHKEFDSNGRRYVIQAYSSSNVSDYRGDDPRYLNADETIVRKYLVEPFVEKYF